MVGCACTFVIPRTGENCAFFLSGKAQFSPAGIIYLQRPIAGIWRKPKNIKETKMETVSLLLSNVLLASIVAGPFAPPVDIAPPPVVPVAALSLGVVLCLCCVVAVIVGVCVLVIRKIKKDRVS